MLTDYYFWFSQPSTVLNKFDWVMGYVFAGLVVLALIIWVVKKFFIQHMVVKKLLQKIVNVLMWVGIVGVIWFGFRYQAIPILSRRVLVGAIVLWFVIWSAFIKVYFWRRFFKEKSEYDYNQLNSRYMGKNK